MKIDHGCVSVCYRAAFSWFMWTKIRKRRRCRSFPIFFFAFARRVLCFNPGEGSTNDCHLVAATIPEDRLRAEERYPRLNSGFSLGLYAARELQFSVLTIPLKREVVSLTTTGPFTVCGSFSFAQTELSLARCGGGYYVKIGTIF